MDKTLMCEVDSRTRWHDFSIWVLYFNLILEKLGKLPDLDFS